MRFLFRLEETLMIMATTQLYTALAAWVAAKTKKTLERLPPKAPALRGNESVRREGRHDVRSPGRGRFIDSGRAD